MNTFFKTIQVNQLFLGLAYIILGLPLIIAPKNSLQLVITILSLVLLFFGAKNCYHAYRFKQRMGYYDSRMSSGVGLLIAALVVFFLSKLLLSFLPIIIGLGVLISGISQLMMNLNIQQAVGHHIGSIIYSVLIIIAGLTILLNPFTGVLVVIQFGGAILIVMGISAIINHFRYKNSNIF